MDPRTLTSVLSALALCACTREPLALRPDAHPICDPSLRPGAVVLSELFANPAGDDAGSEWVELHNRTGAPIDLAGLVLEASGDAGQRPRTYPLPEQPLAASGYVVVGDAEPGREPPHVDHGYGNALGGLRNHHGRLALSCGGVGIDELVYDEAISGIALGLDGNADLGDLAEAPSWCLATEAYAPGALGSPGGINEPCRAAVTDLCRDADGPRAPRPPAPGDLVINEVMANPAGSGTDADAEWIELQVARDIDLNGLVLHDATGRERLTSADCLAVTAGSYALLARSLDPALNGGLERVAARFGLALNNGDERVSVGLGEEIFDELWLAGSRDGVARQLDGDALAAPAGERAERWCDARAAFGDGAGLGSPGAANHACPRADRCTGATGERPVLAPEPGALVISEIFADPEGRDDDQEWIEVAALADLDLNGLLVGDASSRPPSRLGGDACLFVAAGEYAVLARSAEPLENGGLPRVDAVLDVSLNNDADRVYIANGDTLVDEVVYAGARLGVATQLDPSRTDASANDDPSAWCPARSEFGDGWGTPGEANAPCAP